MSRTNYFEVKRLRILRIPRQEMCHNVRKEGVQGSNGAQIWNTWTALSDKQGHEVTLAGRSLSACAVGDHKSRMKRRLFRYTYSRRSHVERVFLTELYVTWQLWANCAYTLSQRVQRLRRFKASCSSPYQTLHSQVFCTQTQPSIPYGSSSG